jgi:flagellar biosynthetic protein FliR
MVAMPLIAAGVVLEVAMGVLIRAVPQVNMFIIGIPVKVLVGLIVLGALIPIFAGSAIPYLQKCSKRPKELSIR